MMELMFVGFYIVYLIEWLVHLAATRNVLRAYRSISFEREAYDHQSDPTYLARRRHYAQWRHTKASCGATSSVE